jgi:hypothetical protein
MRARRREEGVVSTPAAKPAQLPPVTKEDKPLYWTIIIILGITALGALGIWAYTVVQGKTMPDGLSNLLSAIVGGFLGALIPAAKQ